MAGAYGQVAQILTRQGRIAEAVRALRIAIALNPNYFGYHQALADGLLDQGAVDEAIVSYRRTVALRPSSGEAHHKLAVALERAGLAEDAQREFQEAERLGHK